MMIKVEVRINYGRQQSCTLCGKPIQYDEKFYLTRYDFEPRTVRRITCVNCLYLYAEPTA